MSIILVAIFMYANDKIPLEITSISIISALLLFFHFFPLYHDSGWEKLTVSKILMGFANPALMTVLSLLVLGQALIHTGALNEVASIIMRISRNNKFISISMTLLFVGIISAFLNNTPVVVIFIPIIAALAKGMDISVSKVMIPLSYVSILGGMMTLIGSSTNILVSGILRELDQGGLGFFDFTIPGAILASVGFLYVLFVVPSMLPDRASMVKSLALSSDDNRQFVTQVEVDYSSDFVGEKLENGSLKSFSDITIRMIQRGEHAFLPPFESDMIVRPRDIIILSASKKDLAAFYAQYPDTMENRLIDKDTDGNYNNKVTMAEIVVSPTSNVIGKTLEETGFNAEFDCVVLGIQRQSRTIRSSVTDTELASGDVLLVMGRKNNILSLHNGKNFLLMEWTTEEIHSGKNAGLAVLIFVFVVTLSAFGIMPITVSSFVGMTMVLLTGCIPLKRAAKALDLKIVLMIGSSLALGSALQETGGAEFIAKFVVESMDGSSPLFIMSGLFLLMMIITNILSNNATAVLFTPIALNLANQLDADPKMFIFAVIFGCNCSFASPIGYQTNLMVMGPGHHKFSDFMRSGIPLAILMWLTYILYSYLHFI